MNPSRPKALISWSSGKDSAFALHEVRRAGEFDVVGALTTVTETFDRVSIHGVRQEILRAQLRAILRAGADKVSLNTAAIENPELITAGAETFGTQCMVIAIDARRRSASDPAKGWEVFTHGGRHNIGWDALEWAHRAEQLGAGEILLTSMDCDGTRNGYDLELTSATAGAVRIPVIASGGAGKLEHFHEAFSAGGASAVLAASLFHFGEFTIGQVKEYLRERGVTVR